MMRKFPIELLAHHSNQQPSDVVAALCTWWNGATKGNADHFSIYQAINDRTCVNILWPHIGCRSIDELRQTAAVTSCFYIEFCCTEIEGEIALSRNCKGDYIESTSVHAVRNFPYCSAVALQKMRELNNAPTLGLGNEEAGQPGISYMK